MARPESDPLQNLELLAAACELAPELFAARGEAFGVSGEWTMLSVAERQTYIDRCIHMLVAVQPPMSVVISFPKEVRDVNGNR
jgi:hypothetical protein